MVRRRMFAKKEAARTPGHDELLHFPRESEVVDGLLAGLGNYTNKSKECILRTTKTTRPRIKLRLVVKQKPSAFLPIQIWRGTLHSNESIR